jgi:putative nucleotidyltransferase with HDIG domain
MLAMICWSVDGKQLKSRESNDGIAAVEELTAMYPFLPPSFELIPRLLLLLDDPKVSGEQLAELIRVDAGLTADVLHVANSAVFGRGSRIDTLVEAVNRLGFGEICQTVMRIVASPVLENAQQIGFAKLGLWRHSLTTALAGQILATDLGIIEPDLAFTVGLLHDVGKVVLGHALGSSYLTLVEEAKLSKTSLAASERAAFGKDHAKIGAKLLEHWNFPQEIVASIASHHFMEVVDLTEKVSPVNAILYAANILAYQLGSGYGFPSYAVRPDLRVLGEINLDPERLSGYKETVREALEREQTRLTA